LENGRAVPQLQRQRSHEKDRPDPLLVGRNNQLWFVGETIRGLVSPIEFRDRAEYDRFAPVSAFEDSRGHLWAAVGGRGLIEWIPDAEWQRWFPEDLQNDLADHVVRTPGGQLVLATQRQLYRPDAGGGKWQSFSRQEQRFYALLPLENGGYLASVGKL